LYKVILGRLPYQAILIDVLRPLLLKFNSDEKQLVRLFISVFASDCILSPTNGGRPLEVGGPCDACVLAAGIRMTINLRSHPDQWHSIVWPQLNVQILFGLCIQLHRFQVIEGDVYA